MKRTIIKNYADAVNWFNHTDSTIFAVDTELVDANWLTMKLAGMSFCGGERACYIDLLDNPEQNKILELLRIWFSKFDGTLVMHNSPFDLKVLTKYGVINE